MLYNLVKITALSEMRPLPPSEWILPADAVDAIIRDTQLKTFQYIQTSIDKQYPNRGDMSAFFEYLKYKMESAHEAKRRT
jgi:hypothetical protein